MPTEKEILELRQYEERNVICVCQVKRLIYSLIRKGVLISLTVVSKGFDKWLNLNPAVEIYYESLLH